MRAERRLVEMTKRLAWLLARACAYLPGAAAEATGASARGARCCSELQVAAPLGLQEWMRSHGEAQMRH